MEKLYFEERLFFVTTTCMRILGKFFSIALPVFALLMAIGLAWRTLYMPSWPARLFFMLLSLSCVGIGIMLFIKRKRLW